MEKVRRQINPGLQIRGILPDMVDSRTNYARDVITLLWEAYGARLKMYDSIPRSGIIPSGYGTTKECWKRWKA